MSRSLTVSDEDYNPVGIRPLRYLLRKAPFLWARFECRFPEGLAPVIWTDATGAVLQPNSTLFIATSSISSVLHLGVVNGSTTSAVTCKVGANFTRTATIVKGFGVSETKAPTIVSAFLGQDAVLECRMSKPGTVYWTKSNSGIVAGASSPLLRLSSVKEEDAGNYVCWSGRIDISYVNFYVIDRSELLLEESGFSNVSRRQGQSLTRRCQTFGGLGESPDDADWFFAGKPVHRTPNVKVLRSIRDGIGYVDLHIAISEEEHSGIYTCMLKTSTGHQRMRQFSLTVVVTTLDRITNVSARVLHQKACIVLRFVVPPSVDSNFAKFTMFFVITEQTNSTEPLNSLPIDAQCPILPNCAMNVCESATGLPQATQYTLRLSMVLSGSGMVMTPPSDPVTLYTWDGEAKRSVPFQAAMLPDRQLRITWNPPPPKDIDGKVIYYVIQWIDYSSRSEKLLARGRMLSAEVPYNDRQFLIENVANLFVARIRIIPVTRSRALPNATLSHIDRFPFLVFSSTDLETSNAELPTPIISLSQIEHSPIINVDWQRPRDANLTTVVLRYQHVLQMKPSFSTLQVAAATGGEVIVDDVKPGYVHQVCAAYKTVDEEVGPWACNHVVVLNEAGRLRFATEKDAMLPPPVSCLHDSCRCLPADLGLRVEWIAPKSPLGVAKFVSFAVYYGLVDDTQIEAQESVSPDNSTQTSAVLAPLLPESEYRISVQSFNQNDDSVAGDEFICKTASNLPLPPPSHFKYTLPNNTHVELYWTPHRTPVVDGYVIWWQINNEPEQKIFVEGVSAGNIVIGDLQPYNKYQATIASHSPTMGDSDFRSEKVLVRLPQSVIDQLEAERLARTTPASATGNWHESALLRIYLIAAATFSTGFLLLLCIGMCCCMICLKRWPETRARLLAQLAGPGAMQRGRNLSNASSALSISSRQAETRAGIPLGLQSASDVRPLLRRPAPPPPSANAKPRIKDTKGPAGGPRPLGSRRYEALRDDPEFLATLAEMNRDPTGLGLPACERDRCYRQLRIEEERRFQEIVAREKAVLARVKAASPLFQYRQERGFVTSLSLEDLPSNASNGLLPRSQSLASPPVFLQPRPACADDSGVAPPRPHHKHPQQQQLGSSLPVLPMPSTMVGHDSGIDLHLLARRESADSLVPPTCVVAKPNRSPLLAAAAPRPA